MKTTTKLAASMVALTAFALGGCKLEPAMINGGGTINSAGGAMRAQIAFNLNACDEENISGNFQFNDRSALDFQDIGGVKLHGQASDGGFCVEVPNGTVADVECQCNPDEYEIQYDYSSTNPSAPGEGSGYACLLDFGEGNRGDIRGAVILGIRSGPYQGYANVGTVVGNVQTRECGEETDA